MAVAKWAAAVIIGLLAAVQRYMTDKTSTVLFILTDDQDYHMESLRHMPFLHKYLLYEGTLYSNQYCTDCSVLSVSGESLDRESRPQHQRSGVFPPYGKFS